MTKIVRPNLNIQAFASEAVGTERTVFGSTAQSDDLLANLTSNFWRGWGILAAGTKPSKQDFNAATYTATQLTAYLFQNGVAEYADAQEYNVNSITNYNGVLYRSLADNNVGNLPDNLSVWSKVVNDTSLPAWVPFPCPLSDAPDGYLKCNGAGFDKNQYPELAVGYPSGFLPDLRGEFIRGWDNGRGIDAGREILSQQDDELRSHTHTYTTKSETREQTGATTKCWVGETTATTSATGGNETRPRNIAFLYIVRAA